MGRNGDGPKSEEELIRKHIAETMLFSRNGFPYSDDTLFLEAGILDSTNILELVLFIEEQFGITVDDRDVIPDNFDSVNRLASYVKRCKAVVH